MKHLPQGKGRTLSYSEVRAVRDAGDSAYRWFEELAYNDRRSIPISLQAARRINAALWIVGALCISVTMLVAAVSSTPFNLPYLLGAIAAPASLIPSPRRWKTTGIDYLRPALWVCPVLIATTGGLSPWALAAAFSTVLLPTRWWPLLTVAGAAGAWAGTTYDLPWIPLLTVAVAAIIALKLLPPNKAGAGLPEGPMNLVAGWIRPPLNTARLHKPLPDRSLPWFVYLLNPKVRQVVNEVRKNRADQKLPIPNEWAAKVVGAVGERTTAIQLLGLPRNSYLQAHDLQVPGDGTTTANIDHVVIGDSGAWIVDAKQYKGAVEVTNSSVTHGNTDLAPVLRTLAWEAGCLATALRIPVNALILLPDGMCKAPIEVSVPAQRNAAASTVVIMSAGHLFDWFDAQDAAALSGIEKLTTAARLLITTTTATTGRLPHLTLSRGIGYRPNTTMTLAPIHHTLAPERSR